MFAIAFDLVVADTAANHPRGVSQAYADIGAVLSGSALTVSKAVFI
jgi:virulence-associated protein VapD